MLNGVIYKEVQLINRKKPIFHKGQAIDIIVGQITNDGIVNQV